MTELNGLQIIKKLRKQWVTIVLLSIIFVSAGLSVLLAIFSNKVYGYNYAWALLYFFIFFVLCWLLCGVKRITNSSITQWLNQMYPQLQESSHLLLQPLPSLQLLEQLQYHKTGRALAAIDRPLKPFHRLLAPLLSFLLLLSAGLVLLHTSFGRLNAVQPAVLHTVGNTEKPLARLSQISQVNVTIQPPAYTARPARRQQSFNLLAEEGSAVSWQLKTTLPVRQVGFIFNDSMQLQLHAADADHTVWSINQRIDSIGFYQVILDGQVSELYSIETIKDKPPIIIIQAPKQYTTIDIGEPQQVKLQTSISDDYQVNDASLVATIASGSGEAVKFKEQKIPLQGFGPGKMKYNLQQQLSLTALGMHAGDELYFYVQATDGYRQQTRSDICIIHLPDTAQLMSLDGMANSLSLKPEYFRSQRQIIIETIQLIQDKDTITETAFRNRSNNLGIDQKLLRLRYGKFLGDESESGETDAPELEDLSNFSNADKVRDAYTDKHDNAEDASFYEPAIKKQLRATLTEMWSAEKQLRTFTPQAALPFEYKALRLLKDLQQQSRAYVAKTNFKTTPLDLKKRLSGDLSKIDALLQQKDIRQEPDPEIPVRNALSLLESMRTNKGLSSANKDVLLLANRRLLERAMLQPGRYLDAVEVWKQMMDALAKESAIADKTISVAERGLQQLLSVPRRLPAASAGTLQQALSKQYFSNLQKKQP